MKTAQLKKMIEKKVRQDFKKSLAELKKDVFATLDKSGTTDHFKGTGYSIFYTENSNMKGGIENGGGQGYYVRCYHIGMCSDIKL